MPIERRDVVKVTTTALKYSGSPQLLSDLIKEGLERLPKTTATQVSELCDALDVELAQNKVDQEKVDELVTRLEGLLVEHAEIMIHFLEDIRSRITQLGEIQSEGEAQTQGMVSDGFIALMKAHQELSKKVEGLAEMLRERVQAALPKVVFEWSGGSPVRALENFEGREKEMNALEGLVKLTGERKKDFILVRGMPGVGTSALVNQFVAKKGPELFRKGVHHIRAEMMDQDTRRMARKFGWLEGMDIHPADYIRRELEPGPDIEGAASEMGRRSDDKTPVNYIREKLQIHEELPAVAKEMGWNEQMTIDPREYIRLKFNPPSDDDKIRTYEFEEPAKALGWNEDVEEEVDFVSYLKSMDFIGNEGIECAKKWGWSEGFKMKIDAVSYLQNIGFTEDEKRQVAQKLGWSKEMNIGALEYGAAKISENPPVYLIKQVARHLGWLDKMDIEAKDYLLQALKDHENKPLLIVIDGLREDDIVEEVNLPIVKGATLITSPESDLSFSLGLSATELEVEPWPAKDSRAYLKNNSTVCQTESDEDLDALANFVGHLPSLLKLVARMMEANSTQLSEGETHSKRLLKKLQSQSIDALDAVAKGRARGATQIFMASWESLEDHPEDKVALAALEICFQESSFATLQTVSGLKKSVLEDALGRLESASLVRRNENGRYITNNMLREFISKQSAAELDGKVNEVKKEDLLWRHVNWVTKRLKNKDHPDFETALVEATRIVDHAMEIWKDNLEGASEIIEPIYSGLIDTGIYYPEALRLIETFLTRIAAQEEEHGDDELISQNAPIKVKWLKEKGITQLFLTENKAALASLDKGIEFEEAHEGINLDVLSALYIKKAEALLRLATKDKVNPKENAKTCSDLCNKVIEWEEGRKPNHNPIHLAEAYSKSAIVLKAHIDPYDRTGKAEERLFKAEETLKNYCDSLKGGENKEEYHQARLELAATYTEDFTIPKDDPCISFNKQPEYLEKALEICLDSVGENHLRTLRCYEKLAIAYSEIIGSEDPFKFLDKAIEIGKVIYKDRPKKLANLYEVGARMAGLMAGSTGDRNYYELAQSHHSEAKKIDPNIEEADLGGRVRAY